MEQIRVLVQMTGGALKITKVKKITDYPFLNMYEVAYRDLGGREKIWQIASRSDPPKSISGKFDLPDAVVIVPYHRKQQKMAIIREFRIPLNDYQYGFPAGLVDPGESVEETVKRELFEETGLTVTDIVRISPPIYNSSGITDESISMVYVECEGEHRREKNTSGSEDIETLFVDAPEAAALCGRGDIKFDVKTWLVLYEYGRTGRIFT